MQQRNTTDILLHLQSHIYELRELIVCLLHVYCSDTNVI